jgi:hypothetical protein
MIAMPYILLSLYAIASYAKHDPKRFLALGLQHRTEFILKLIQNLWL